MSNVIKGVAEAVSSKEGKPHPKYGVSYQTSIKVNGVWYGAFTKKSAEQLGLAKDRLVSFTWVENGEYKNFDPKSLSVSTTQGTDSTPTASGSAPTKAAYSGGSNSGIKVGHAINNAVQLAVAKGDTSLKAIHGHAVDIITLSVKLEGQFDRIIAVAQKKLAEATEGKPDVAASATPAKAASSPKTEPAAKTAKAKAKPAPAPEPEPEAEEDVPAPDETSAEPEFNDDIPF